MKPNDNGVGKATHAQGNVQEQSEQQQSKQQGEQEPRLKEIIAVVNNKGGVAKTTTVQNVAAGLVRFGAEYIGHTPRVLVIDLDSQCSISSQLGWKTDREDTRKTVYEALRDGSGLPVYQSYKSTDNFNALPREGIFYCPGSKMLTKVDADLYRAMNPKKVLFKCFGQPLVDASKFGLTDITEDFDYVLIDCPPAMNEVTYNALGVASQMLVPVELESMAIQGLSEVYSTYEIVKAELNSGLDLLGILRVKVQARLNTAKDFTEFIGEGFESKMFKSFVRRSDLLSQAQAFNLNIFEYKPYMNPGFDYERVTKEVLERTL